MDLGKTFTVEFTSAGTLTTLRSRRATEDSSSRWIMRLVSVFILETNNQTNNVRPDG